MDNLKFIFLFILGLSVAAFALFNFGIFASADNSGLDRFLALLRYDFKNSNLSYSSDNHNGQPDSSYSPPDKNDNNSNNSEIADSTPSNSQKPYFVLEVDEDDVPFGFTTEDLSPYFGAVVISSVRHSGFFSPRITLSADFRGVLQFVNISGWSLRSNSGNTMVIPQGVEYYDPYGIRTKTDIRLRDKNFVEIYARQSSLGRAVHLNKCMGYLEKNLDISPLLNLSCPLPYEEDRNFIITLKGQCQEYIRSLQSCEIPDINQRWILADRACLSYLKTINYKTCYERHIEDYDFLEGRWLLWMDDDFLKIDPLHDRLLLFDDKGLLVDEYIY